MLRKILLRPARSALLPAVAGPAPQPLAGLRPVLPRPALLTRLSALPTRLARAYRCYRQRRALLALSDAMLKDIGISRADALHEGSKGFWQD